VSVRHWRSGFVVTKRSNPAARLRFAGTLLATECIRFSIAPTLRQIYGQTCFHRSRATAGRIVSSTRFWSDKSRDSTASWSYREWLQNYLYPTNIEGNRPFCYAINANGVSIANWGLVKATPLNADTVTRQPSEIRMPSDMIAIGDEMVGATNRGPCNWVKLTGWGVFHGVYVQSTLDSSRPVRVGTVRSQGANMVFLDGHLEWNRWWKWVEFSNAAARRWNYDNEPHPEMWGK